MIQVNIVSLTNLTHLFLQDMRERKTGKILNVASTAGFIPGPLQAVYFATKAYVNSFSLAISQELIGTGVSVTALCPGPVATEFAKVGNLEGIEAFKSAASAKSVAECGYKAMELGRMLVINDIKISFLLNWIVPFVPRRLVLLLTQKSMEKSD